jgi:hypothetical protein
MITQANSNCCAFVPRPNIGKDIPLGSFTDLELQFPLSLTPTPSGVYRALFPSGYLKALASDTTDPLQQN